MQSPFQQFPELYPAQSKELLPCLDLHHSLRVLHRRPDQFPKCRIAFLAWDSSVLSAPDWEYGTSHHHRLVCPDGVSTKVFDNSSWLNPHRWWSRPDYLSKERLSVLWGMCSSRLEQASWQSHQKICAMSFYKVTSRVGVIISGVYRLQAAMNNEASAFFVAKKKRCEVRGKWGAAHVRRRMDKDNSRLILTRDRLSWQTMTVSCLGFH